MNFKKTTILAIVVAVAFFAGYAGAYFLAPRLPAANLAYFVYSDTPRVDSACYYFFLPAYRLHQNFNKLRHTGFARHNWDRPKISPE